MIDLGNELNDKIYMLRNDMIKMKEGASEQTSELQGIFRQTTNKLEDALKECNTTVEHNYTNHKEILEQLTTRAREMESTVSGFTSGVQQGISQLSSQISSVKKHQKKDMKEI